MHKRAKECCKRLRRTLKHLVMGRQSFWGGVAAANANAAPAAAAAEVDKIIARANNIAAGRLAGGWYAGRMLNICNSFEGILEKCPNDKLKAKWNTNTNVKKLTCVAKCPY